MRKLLLITLLFNIIMALTPFMASTGHAQINPWPWAKPLPFPWNEIEGTWREKSTNFTFMFKVIENSDGIRHIKIKQIDRYSGRIIAQGQGYEQGEDMVVAAMTGGQHTQYLITIRLLANVFCQNTRKVTGVTIESYDHQLLNHFEIHKIKDLPLTQNNNEVYKHPNPTPVGQKANCLEASELPVFPDEGS